MALWGSRDALGRTQVGSRVPPDTKPSRPQLRTSVSGPRVKRRRDYPLYSTSNEWMERVAFVAKKNESLHPDKKFSLVGKPNCCIPNGGQRTGQPRYIRLFPLMPLQQINICITAVIEPVEYISKDLASSSSSRSNSGKHLLLC